MKEKIKLILITLIYKKPLIYISIFVLSGYMIGYSIIEYQVKQKIAIENLNQAKEKIIKDKEKELKPLIDKQKELTLELDKLKLKIKPINKCINGIKESLGTLREYECNKSIIQKASASEEECGGRDIEGVCKKPSVTEPIGREPLGIWGKDSIRLKPNDLFYTTKKSDGCHISQNEQSHFTKAGGYMLATDVACDFNKDGKADQAEVYAPDYLDEEREYIIKKKHDDLLGDYVELLFDTKQISKGKLEFNMGLHNAKWIIGHTTTKLKDGEVVETGQRIGQNNLTGYTTGYHSHIELWSLIDGKWKNISYTTRSETLNNKRNNILSKWKEGDKFYFTSYHIGDVNQNDSSPYIGASGKDLRHISNPIALTIDVRKSLGIKWGDKVKLTGPCTGIYQVEDEMNQRFRYSNIMKDGVPIKGDLAIPLGTEAKCSGIYSITKI